MEILNNFHLLRPAWLLAALPACLLVGWLWRRSRSGQGWRQVIHPKLLPFLLEDRGTGSSSSPVQALLLIWLLATLAMAGPSWEKIPQPVQRKQDALVILLDLSYSMLAEDVSPSRLLRSRHKLLDLLQQRKEGTTALVAYAGDAHVVSPLTDDHRTIANLLPALTPQIMPVKGNRPEQAVEQALTLFRSAGVSRGQILLVSDGVRERDVDAIGKLLKPTRFSLSVLGIGTSDGGPVPIPPQGLLKDASNQIVIVSLEREPLVQLANANGGTYSDLSLDESDLERVIQAPLDPNQEQELLLDRSADQWHDLGFWLVLALLPLALGSFRRGWLLCIPLLLLMPPRQAAAFEWQDLWQTPDQQAARLLEQGESSSAADTFQDPDWKAAANYRAQDYASALEHYAKTDSAKSWYNRGNTLARSGQLAEAIDAYDEALARAPALEDASFNKALLEQLQQQQQNQSQSQQNQEQQNESQQDQHQQNQDQKNQGQQDQEHEQQDQEQPGQDRQPRNQESPRQQDKEPQSKEQEQQPQQQTQTTADEEQQQAAAEQSDEEQEREQATEQWLRRVPDDPAGLLRRKFKYESQQNKQRQPENDETYW